MVVTESAQTPVCAPAGWRHGNQESEAAAAHLTAGSAWCETTGTRRRRRQGLSCPTVRQETQHTHGLLAATDLVTPGLFSTLSPGTQTLT